jgi:hypothetical protein
VGPVTEPGAVPASHLLPPTAQRRGPGWWHVATERRRLGAARRAVPAVLAQVASTYDPAASWVPAAGIWTGTGMAVFGMGSGTDAAVLRMAPGGQQRLQRELQVLQHLAGLSLPPALVRLMPRCLAAGSVGDYDYVVDAALPGRSAHLLVGQPVWPELQAEAFAAADLLHRSTAREVLVDEPLLARWVEEPLAVVERISSRLPGAARQDRVALLRKTLRDGLVGRRVLASWVHGDFWPGNLLADESGLSGIVDWDLAAPDELAVHDYLHLLLSCERDVSGLELGDIVCRLAAPGHVWTPAEQAVLDACSWVFPDGPPTGRVLVLLHWLRHVAAVSVQQQSYVTHSVRVWEVRNVHRILRSL